MAVEFGSLSLFSDANLKGYWKLENVSASYSTNDLTNTGVVAFNPGQFNNAADFSTANSSKYVSVSTNLGISGGNITMSCWFRLNCSTAGTVPWPLFFQGCGSSQYVNYAIVYDCANYWSEGSNRVVALRQKQLVGDTVTSIAMTLSTAAWHHAALTYSSSSGNMYLYLDGVTSTAATVTGFGVGTANNMVMMGFSNGQFGNRYAPAMVDDAVIFNRVLSTAEIVSIYTGPPPTTATVNYLKGRRNRWDFSGVSAG